MHQLYIAPQVLNSKIISFILVRSKTKKKLIQIFF